MRVAAGGQSSSQYFFNDRRHRFAVYREVRTGLSKRSCALQIYISNGWMDAYPDWPNLHYLIIQYSNGERIWGMPLYQSPNCANSYTCKQALFNINKRPVLKY